MEYKNMGLSTKIYYGVIFKPGDIKSVPGYINSSKFISVGSKPKVEIVEDTKNSKPDKPKHTSKRNTPKVEEPKMELPEEVEEGKDTEGLLADVNIEEKE